MSTIVLGSTPVVECRLQVSWTGAWIADCELDGAKSAPTGMQSLTIGKTALIGTIDPRATGNLADRFHARLVAGAGAWGNTVDRMHLHLETKDGVSSATALAKVAKAIGETLVDPNPIFYGPDWVFLTGPAVGALEGRQWYVDASGVTRVADWPTIALGSDVDVISYDPETRRIELAADEVVWPGTTFTDIRFGTVTIRDVDQRFNAEGSHVTAWHSTLATSRFDRIIDAIASLGGEQWLKIYRYRIGVQRGDGRLQLQAVDPSTGAPDTLPLSVWPGMAGLSAKYTLGTVCSVVFLEGNKALPRVIAFDGSAPQELYLDATTLIRLGKNASNGVARKGDNVHCGFIVLTGAGLPAQYFPGDVPPSTVNQQAAQTAATNIGGTVFPLIASGLGGVVISASSKVMAE